MKFRSPFLRFVMKDLLIILLLTFLLLFIATLFAKAQEVQAWGDDRWGQCAVPADLEGVIAISAGVGHSVALKYDGTVTVWGLHAANSVTEVNAIASGNLHTVALKSDGTVVAWGNNTQGQLNIPPGLTDVTSIAAGNFHTLALKADGTVVAWGSNSQSQSTVPGGLTEVIAISGGYGHSLALKADGSVVGWGATGGTVPVGLNNVIAIDAGGYFNLALKSDGTVVAWGDNARGQCNIPPGLSDVIAISAGYEHAVALKADGTIEAWGNNDHGQTTVPPDLTGVVEISAGSWFTMARKVTGTRIAVWGSSLSTLSPPSFNISDIKAVAAGRTAGLALNPNGTVTAWGTGNIVSALPIGLTDVKTIGAGVDHGVALRADGTVVSWGANSFGERDVPPGLTDVKAIAVGSYHNVALKSDGTVVRWGNAAANASFPSALSGVTAVAAGSVHSLALKANGTVEAWGSNFEGETTVPGGLVNVIDIAGGNLHTLALNSDGKVQGWGANDDGQYNFPTSLANVRSVAAGQTHSLVLKSDGTLFTKGRNGADMSFIPPGLNAVIAIDTRLNNNVALVIDQPPLISGIATGMNYLEGATALTLQSTAVITDNGHTSLTGATISISDGFLAGDKLAITVRAGVTQAYDAATGVLTLTGNGTITDYQLMLRSLTYESTSASPASNATRTISVSVNDGTQTATLSFTLNVIGVNDAPSFNLIGSLIIDEDSPAVNTNWVSSISRGPADEAGQTLTFEVENNNHSLFSVQPQVSSAGRLSFTLAPDAFGSANVMIRLIDNGGTANGGMDRLERNFSITVNSVNDAPSFIKGSDIVINEDAATQTITGWATNMLAGPANEAAQTLAFSVSNNNTGLFSAQPSLNAAGNLTFTPAPNAAGVATVTVTLTDNGGTTLGGINSFTQTFSITINDVNDAPTFTTGTSIFAWEDSPPQTLSGWLTNPSPGPAEEAGQTLTVETENSNNSLFAVQPAVSLTGALTFTLAPHANGSVTIAVRLIDDGGTANGGVDRTEKTFSLTVQTVNDAPSFTKGPDVTITEDAGEQTVNGWATNISPGPADEAMQTLVFSVNNNNNAGLFAVQPALDATGDLTFTPAANVSGVAHVTFTLTDNGGTLRGGTDNVSQTFTITINPVNDAPLFTGGSNVVVNEDEGEQTVTAWATGMSSGPSNESGQTLTFNLSNNNNRLFSVQPSLNAMGDLMFTPTENQAGIATVSITLQDDGGTANGGVDQSAAHVFTITVDPVNDAPGFIKGANISINEDAGAQNINGWATNISSGPSDEVSQTLTFTVSNDNNALFVTQPSVDASGNLAFTPATDAAGSAVVTVTLKDNGGIANGGVDEFTQTFTISIENANEAPFFTGGPDVIIFEDAGPYAAPWATGISAGEGESFQSLTFAATTSATSLFTEQPAINPAGILSFKLASNAHGSATVTVWLRDNGGTSNGGIDKSQVSSFTITALPVNDAPVIDPIENLTINSNSQPVTITLTGIHAGDEAQTISIEAVSDSSLVAVAAITYSHGSTATILLTFMEDKTGIAIITVKVKDNGGVENGGADESIEIFTISIEEAIHETFLPNLFTPDRNGVNDALRVRAGGVAEIQFKIYNASGQEVFSTNDLNIALETGWDGRYRGKEQPAGTYTWTLTGKYVDGRSLTGTKNRYGQVVLMR